MQQRQEAFELRRAIFGSHIEGHMRRHVQGLRFGSTCTQAVRQVGVCQAQIDAQVIQLQGAQLCYSPVT